MRILDKGIDSHWTPGSLSRMRILDKGEGPKRTRFTYLCSWLTVADAGLAPGAGDARRWAGRWEVLVDRRRWWRVGDAADDLRLDVCGVRPARAALAAVGRTVGSPGSG